MYEEQIKQMQWSFSRLSCFEQCPYEFYLQYIVKDDELYPKENNYYAEVGSVVHEVLADVFEGKVCIDDSPKVFMERYERDVVSEAKKSTMEKKYEQCAMYFSEVDFNWMKDYEIVGVELNTELEIEGYKFVGFIDLLIRDKTTGEFAVIDHKSSAYFLKRDGSVKKSSAHDFNKYKKQMYLYCHAVHELFGVYPKWISWNHFLDGGRFTTIPFVFEEYQNTIRWMIDSIHRIEIEKEFNPNPEYFYCKYLCSFRTSCEYRNEVSNV